MKNASSATSSDLERARDLSRKLRPELPLGESAARPALAGGAFVRFRAADVSVSPKPTGAIVSSADARETEGHRTLSSTPAAGILWDPFLDWCRAVAAATTAFILDTNGLTVSVRGTVTAEEAEGIGSRVMVALEQARKIQPAGATDPGVSIDFGGGRLSGFGVALKDGSFLTIGLIGPRSVDPAARATIEQAFRARG